MSFNYEVGDRVVVNGTQVGTITYVSEADDIFGYRIHDQGGINDVLTNISVNRVESAKDKSAEDIGHNEPEGSRDPVTNTGDAEDDPERVERDVPTFPDFGNYQQDTQRHRNVHVPDTSVFDDENSDGLKVDDDSADSGSDD